MYKEARRKTYELFAPGLGGKAGTGLDWFIMGLIVLNVVAFMLESVDWIGEVYATYFHWFEILSVAIFTVEYFSRIWSAVEAGQFENPITGRVSFARRPLMIVDLLAILPFYLGGALGLDLRFLRALRLIRVVRLFKLARYSHSLQIFRSVIESEKEKIVIAGYVNTILLVIAASVMYKIEHQAQPEAFSSIPETLWWGVITLTTVGYGDVAPVTPLGQFFGAIIAVLGIGMFALPASILASGFISQSRTWTRTCPNCGEDIDETDI